LSQVVDLIFDVMVTAYISKTSLSYLFVMVSITVGLLFGSIWPLMIQTMSVSGGFFYHSLDWLLKGKQQFKHRKFDRCLKLYLGHFVAFFWNS